MMNTNTNTSTNLTWNQVPRCIFPICLETKTYTKLMIDTNTNTSTNLTRNQDAQVYLFIFVLREIQIQI